MRIGRPIPELVIAAEQRTALQNWARRPKSAQALALRGKIILACSEGKSNTAEVAEPLSDRKQMVGKWRARFVENGLDGLLDEPRPGTPRKVSDAEVERVLAADSGVAAARCYALEHALAGRQCGLSRSTVSRIWRAFALQPHRSETFKLSNPLFIEKVRDIVGLYLNPPDRALVLCVDEKSRIRRLTERSHCCPCAGTSRASQSRLPTPGDVPVCRARCEEWDGDRRLPSPAPRRGVPQVSRHH